MVLTLEEETHTYRNIESGTIIPSVTQIIDSVFPFEWGSEFAMQRGRAVHHAIHLYEQGVLDWNTVDERIKGYMRAYEKFRQEMKIEPIATEEIVYSKAYGFCGTLDMRTERMVFDFKTGVKSFTHGMQLAAYVSALNINLKRCGVYLRPDGKYNVEPYKNKSDLYDFLACLRIYNKRQMEGLL